MKNKLLQSFTLLTIIEAFLAAFWLISLPSDAGTGFGLHLSPQRMMILLPMVGVVILLVIFAIRSRGTKIDLLVEQKNRSFGWKLFNAIRIGLYCLNALLVLFVLIAPIFLNVENEVYLFQARILFCQD